MAPVFADIEILFYKVVTKSGAIFYLPKWSAFQGRHTLAMDWIS